MVIAVISEKTVSISAARVAGRRHSALDNRRMADSMTPAWLIPIQKTKLVMKNPHITGRFKPVTPKPWLIMKPAVLMATSTMKPRTARAPKNHLGEFRMLTSSSLFTCLEFSGLPSCMMLRRDKWSSYSGLPRIRYSPRRSLPHFW